MLDAPLTPLEQLPCLGLAERALLERMTRAPRRAIPDLTLAQLFAAQAARTPHALAVADDDTRLDYAALDRRANAFAWTLRRAHGVQPGDVVAVLLEREVAWAVALLGVLKAGAVYLPLDARHPPARQRALLQRAGAKVLVAREEGRALRADGSCTVVAAPEGAEEPRAPDATVQPAFAPAYLIFTSGSTGEPKGVRVQHRAFVNMILAQVESFGITPRDVVLQLASCAFDASLSEFFMAWACGAGVAIASHAATRDGPLLAGAIRRHAATVVTLTPSHLRQLADAELAGLRTVVLAAEAVLGGDARRLQALGIDVFNAYGPTETAVCATLMRVESAPAAAAPVPIGRPLANLALRVVDALGRDTPLGVPARSSCQGEGVALGYLDDPAASASSTRTTARALPHRRHRPLAAEGVVEYLGRKDAQVKIAATGWSRRRSPGWRRCPGTAGGRAGAPGPARHAPGCLPVRRTPARRGAARGAGRALAAAPAAGALRLAGAHAAHHQRQARSAAWSRLPCRARGASARSCRERARGRTARGLACLPAGTGWTGDRLLRGRRRQPRRHAVARRVGRELGRAARPAVVPHAHRARLAAALAAPVPP